MHPKIASRIALPLLWLACSGLWGCGPAGTQTAVDRARALREKGRPAEAADILAGPAKRNPEDAALLIELARCQHEAGRDDDALVAVETALKAAPRDAEAHVLHGTILAALNREEDGLRELRLVVAAEPQRRGVHRAMGSILARSGRYGAAVNQFEKELSLNPDDPDTLTDLGIFYLQTNQIEQAEDRLRRAASIGQGNARAHRFLAEVDFRQAKREEGLEEQRRALALAPDDVELLVAHARALAGYGHADEARRVLTQAIDRGVKDARLYVERGREMRDGLDYDGAVAAFSEAAKIDPSLAEAHLDLGRTYLYQGRRAEARAAFEEALRLAPTDPYAGVYLAGIVMDDGQYDQAVTLLRRSLELDPLNPKAHYALAQALQRLGKNDEAQAEFARHADILKRLRESKQSGTSTLD